MIIWIDLFVLLELKNKLVLGLVAYFFYIFFFVFLIMFFYIFLVRRVLY